MYSHNKQRLVTSDSDLNKQINGLSSDRDYVLNKQLVSVICRPPCTLYNLPAYIHKLDYTNKSR